MACALQLPLNEGSDQGNAFMLSKSPVLQDVANNDPFGVFGCAAALDVKPVDFTPWDESRRRLAVELPGYQGSQEATQDQLSYSARRQEKHLRSLFKGKPAACDAFDARQLRHMN